MKFIIQQRIFPSTPPKTGDGSDARTAEYMHVLAWSQSLYPRARDGPLFSCGTSTPCCFQISIWRSFATIPVRLS